VKAVNDARAKEVEYQKAVEASVKREKDLTDQIYQTRAKIVEIKGDQAGALKPNTALPNLGNSGEAASPAQEQRQGPPAQGQNGDHQQASADFAQQFNAALMMYLLPALCDSLRGLGARINNANSIG